MGNLKNSTELEELKKDARDEFSGVLDKLSSDHPDAAKRSAALVVGTLGDSASLTALHYGGSVAGLSAAGVTSSGPAVVGHGSGSDPVRSVLAHLVAVVAVVAYVRERRRKAKLAAAHRTAIEKLHRMQERLTANAEFFAAELAEIRAYIDVLERELRDDK